MTERVNQRFLMKRWPDGAVVYDTATGDTHTMDVYVTQAFESALLDAAECQRNLEQARMPPSASEERARECLEFLSRLELLPSPT